MKRKEHKGAGRMALKLDMSKDYDGVKLGYIRAIMSRLGFQQSWINLVMSCVTYVHYSMLVNRKLGKTIIPLRGLGQGDLLSLNYFILCVEGFSLMVNQVELRGDTRAGY